MGAWGEGIFDNDWAADWAATFDDTDVADRLGFITRTLERGTASGYIDIDVGEAVLAAAAVVASQVPDGPALDPSYGPQTLGDTVGFEVTDELRALTVQALRGVTGANSEWLELWADSDADPLALANELITVLTD
ncbi:MAG: DUF4259 domain-containing protein [Mycobacterium sp.]